MTKTVLMTKSNATFNMKEVGLDEVGLENS